MSSLYLLLAPMKGDTTSLRIFDSHNKVIVLKILMARHTFEVCISQRCLDKVPGAFSMLDPNGQ